jgi:hypothetical protein
MLFSAFMEIMARLSTVCGSRSVYSPASDALKGSFNVRRSVAIMLKIPSSSVF